MQPAPGSGILLPMDADAQDRGPVTLTLRRDEALVLHEWLRRRSRLGLDTEEALACIDQAEQRVLWDVATALERVLVEASAPDYEDLLEDAWTSVRDVRLAEPPPPRE